MSPFVRSGDIIITSEIRGLRIGIIIKSPKQSLETYFFCSVFFNISEIRGKNCGN